MKRFERMIVKGMIGENDLGIWTKRQVQTGKEKP